jgi:hypothetical protein
VVISILRSWQRVMEFFQRNGEKTLVEAEDRVAEVESVLAE